MPSSNTHGPSGRRRPLAALLLLAAGFLALGPRSEAGERHLFLDPHLLQGAQGVARVVNPPQEREIVIRPDQPWEQMMITFYTSVVDDHGKIRMWYDCRDKTNTPNLAYAESDDGIHWRKPALGRFDYHGNRSNNLVGLPNFEGTVFEDPHAADPASRFVYVTTVYRGGGIFRFASADGYTWKRDAKPLLPFMADSQNVTFWDEPLHRYVLFFRGWDLGEKHGHQRNVVRLETDRLDTPLPIKPSGRGQRPKEPESLIADEAPTVLACDNQDPDQTDVYTNAIQRYAPAPRWYVGFPAFYRHAEKPRFRNDGRTEVQFIASEDGTQWDRFSRFPYVRPGLAESENANMVFIGTGLIYRGDEIWQFGTGYRTSHGDVQGRLRQTDGVIYRYVQRIDGFVSLDFDPAGGRCASEPAMVDGSSLRLNLDTGTMGEVRVGLRDQRGQPLPGFEAENCDPLRINATGALVSWAGRSDLSALRGRSVVVTVTGSRAKLYSWRFE